MFDLQFILDFLKGLLTPLINRFRTNNPVIAGIIFLVLATLLFVAAKGEELGLFELNSVWDQVLMIVTFVTTFFAGVGQKYLLPGKEADQNKQLPDNK